MAGVLTQDQLNAIAQSSGYTGGSFSSVGLPTTPQVSNESLGLPKTISSASLQAPPVQNYQTSTPSPYYPVSTLATPDFSLSAPQQQASDLSKQLQGLNNSEAGKSAYQVEQEQLAGVPGYQKTINDLGSQLTGIKNEAAAIPLQLQQGAADRGVTTPVLGQQENSRLRTNAIAALGVSTLLSAAQGNLATAQSMADKAVEQKYGPIEDQIKTGLANLQLIINSPEYTQAEKAQAFQQQQALQTQSDAVAQQKSDYSSVLKVATDAASNIQSFKPTTQYPTASVALQAISQATDPQTALQIAASVGLTGGSSGTPRIIGSASSGYYQVNPDGTTTPVNTGSGGGGGSAGGIAKGSLSSKAFVNKVLSSQGVSYDDAVAAIPQGKIGVIDNATGKVGTIDSMAEYDSSKYTLL